MSTVEIAHDSFWLLLDAAPERDHSLNIYTTDGLAIHRLSPEPAVILIVADRGAQVKANVALPQAELTKERIKKVATLIGECISATGEHRIESRLLQDACHRIALVALDFDATVLHRATTPTGRLHLFGQCLLLWQSDPLESLDHGHSFARAMGGLADDVDPAAIRVLLSAFRGAH